MPEKKFHDDPLVADLQAICGLSWSRSDEFDSALRILWNHPAVMRGVPDEADARVDAIQAYLHRAIASIKAREPAYTGPKARYVAESARVILGLDEKHASMNLTERRQTIHDRELWMSNRREPISPDGFRNRHEVEGVLVPVAEHVRAEAHKDAEVYDDVDLEEGDDRYAPQPNEHGAFVARLRKLEQDSSSARLTELSTEGRLVIRDEAEMLAILLLMLHTAQHELQAVDYTPIAEWGDNPKLSAYLEKQLATVRDHGIRLTRIRIAADQELTDPESRKALRSFVRRHEAVGAGVILCGTEALEIADTSFRPNSGLLLADSAHQPIAVRGKLAERSVGDGTVFMRDNSEMDKIRSEHEGLRAVIESHGYDARIRKALRLKKRAGSG